MPTRKRNTRLPQTERRSRAATLTRQQQQKPIAAPAMLVRQRIINQLHDVVGSCEDLFTEHGPDCDCQACCVTTNLVGSVKVFAMLLAAS